MNDRHIIQCQQLIADNLPFDYQGSALDFKLNTGEVSSIIGPHYSGKGTWIKTLCGLQDQHSGKLYINGADTSNISAKEWMMSRIKVAYLHEETALLSATNGLNNVLIPALYHQLDKTLNKKVLIEKALALLADIDPELNLDDLPAYLTKDHQYKIAIARALLLEPDVLVLNNPFAHFNSDSKQQFQNFLDQQVKKGLALLFVTHDIPYALSISDKIIFTSRNELLHFDSKQALLNCDIPVVNEFMKRQKNQVSP